MLAVVQDVEELRDRVNEAEVDTQDALRRFGENLGDLDEALKTLNGQNLASGLASRACKQRMSQCPPVFLHQGSISRSIAARLWLTPPSTVSLELMPPSRRLCGTTARRAPSYKRCPPPTKVLWEQSASWVA